MSNVPEKTRSVSPWSNNQQSGTRAPFDSDPSRIQKDRRATSQGRAPSSQPSSGSSRPPNRPNFPTRSSTADTPRPDRSPFTYESTQQARSDDLNHGSSNYYTSGAPSSPPALSSSRRPVTPAGSKPQDQVASGGNSEESNDRLSTSSLSTANSDPDAIKLGPPSSTTSVTVSPT